jgi:hypothetical protein
MTERRVVEIEDDLAQSREKGRTCRYQAFSALVTEVLISEEVTINKKPPSWAVPQH